MNEKWSDFEKYVFAELSKISAEIATLKGRAAVWGALAGLIVTVVGEAALKVLFHP